MEDFFVTWLCGPCALCQERREIMIRDVGARMGQNPMALPTAAASVATALVPTYVIQPGAASVRL